MTERRLPGRTTTGVERGDARRRALIEAAIDLVAAQGSRATTLAEIAAAAGVTRAGLLHHFGSKDELLHAVLAENERVSDTVTPLIFAPGGGLASIRALVEIVRRDVANRRQALLWNTLLAENTAEGSPLYARMAERFVMLRSGAAHFLQQARDAGEIRDDVDIPATAIEIIACINGMETLWLLDEHVAIVEITDAYLARLVDGLRPRSGDASA